MNIVPLSQLEEFTLQTAKALLNARVELLKLGVASEIPEVTISAMVVDDTGINAVERTQKSKQPETVQTTVRGAESQTQTHEPVVDRQSQGFGRSTTTDVTYTS
ncbi:MAG TPA: hypothetical protein VD994_20345 [Prosthecobacter sp.]|nr:hypothetical protein [Prosthecobacter sp.]